LNSENKNIIRHFLEASVSFPENIAIAGNQKIIYSELLIKVKSRSACFTKKGIQKGDRVLVFVPMSEELYINLLALFYIGAVPVFVDEWVNKQRLELCCSIASCKAFIAPLKFRMVALFFREIRKIPVWLKPDGYNSGKSEECAICDKNDPALITFTTGSTGTPKAAIRTHGILNAQFAALKEKTGISSSDTVMTTLPIVLLINLGCGAASVMAEFKPAKPWKLNTDLINEQLNKFSVSILIASPFFLLELCKNKSDHVKLKKIYTGGAPVFPSDAEKIINTFPAAGIEIIFGSTEAEPISGVNAIDLAASLPQLESNGLLAGKINKVAEVEIIKITDSPIGEIHLNDWEKLKAEKNNWGEIVVSGEHVVKNYLANETAFRENKIVVENTIWHRTGDAGRIDKNGNLWLAGRCKQIFFNNEKMISPFIYEGILKNINGISNGTVLKKNNKMVIVAEKEKDTEENLIKKELIKSKIIFDEIIYLRSLPKDPRHFSKIDYDKLKQIISF